MSEARRSEVGGSVYVELEVSGRWAVSLLTQGWTEEERRALADGDREALDALVSEAGSRVLAVPNEVEDRHVEITLNGARVDA